MGDTDIRNVQVDVAWQVLRVGTFPRYNPLGGWDTPRGVLSNLTALNDYAHASLGADIVRLHRVRRFLGTVLRDYNASRGEMEAALGTMIHGYILSQPLPGTLPREAKIINWNKVLDDLRALIIMDIEVYHNVRRELSAQSKNAMGLPSGMDKMLIMMNEVANGVH